MAYTFDGPNKLIILPPGMTTLDVKDVYSRWKEWAGSSNNLCFLPFFDVVGGNPTTGNNSISSYYYLINGAKIRPYEGNHTLTVDGILIGENDSDPFTNTIGTYRVRIVQVVPMQAETVYVSSEGSTGPTTGQIAEAVWRYSR